MRFLPSLIWRLLVIQHTHTHTHAARFQTGSSGDVPLMDSLHWNILPLVCTTCPQSGRKVQRLSFCGAEKRHNVSRKQLNVVSTQNGFKTSRWWAGRRWRRFGCVRHHTSSEYFTVCDTLGQNGFWADVEIFSWFVSLPWVSQQKFFTFLRWWDRFRRGLCRIFALWLYFLGTLLCLGCL